MKVAHAKDDNVIGGDLSGLSAGYTGHAQREIHLRLNKDNLSVSSGQL